MMIKRFLFLRLVPAFALLVLSILPCQAEEVTALYVLPFEQGAAPEGTATALFDGLVDRLFELGEENGVAVTIVKQELTDADAEWFTGKHYLIGEMASYSEDKGCCYTEIKMTGRIQLHRPGNVKQPILELADESFFNHDITALPAAQTELSDRMGREMAVRLIRQIKAD